MSLASTLASGSLALLLLASTGCLESRFSRPASAPAPQYGQPAYGQPAYGQPAYGQPAYGQPAYGQPAYPPQQSAPPPAAPQQAPWAWPFPGGPGERPPAAPPAAPGFFGIPFPAPAFQPSSATGVTMYAASWCGACRSLEAKLRQRSIPYIVVDAEQNQAAYSRARAASGKNGIPLTDVTRNGQVTWVSGDDADAVERAYRGQ